MSTVSAARSDLIYCLKHLYSRPLELKHYSEVNTRSQFTLKDKSLSSLSFLVSELKRKEEKSQWTMFIEDISVLQWVLSFLFLGKTCNTHTRHTYSCLMAIPQAFPCVVSEKPLNLCEILLLMLTVSDAMCMCVGTFCLGLMVYLMFTSLWLIPTLYCTWQVYDWYTPEKGKFRTVNANV